MLLLMLLLLLLLLHCCKDVAEPLFQQNTYFRT